MKKRIFSLFLSLIMVMGLVSVVPITAGAANDSMANAESYTLGTVKSSYITTNLNSRVYKFTLPSSGKIKISYSGYMEYSDVFVYDSNGEERYSCKYMRWNDNTKKITLTDYIDLTKGTYYFSVAKRYDCTGNFDFSITFTSAGESFVETGKGTNNSILTANAISLNSTYKGQIANNDDCDVYKFTVSSSGKIKISYSGYMEYSDVFVYDSNGEERYSCKYMRWNDNTKKITLTDYIDLTKGTYYFSIAKRYSCTGNFDFSITFTSAGESFVETGKGTNNSILTANAISLNSTYKGQIANNDDCDVYKFIVSSSGRISISYTGYMEYSDVYIYDSDGVEQYSCTYMRWNDNTKKITLTDYIDLTKGTYYFYIAKRYGCTGNYSFSLSQYIAPPANITKATLTPAETSVKMSWSKVSGATGYRVYKYDTTKKTWVKQKDITGTSYTFSGLKAGTTYKFTVKAYKTVSGKTVFSPKYSTFTTSTNPAKVNFTLTAGSKKATVKWSKVTGATGYIVYYKTSSNGKWVKLTTTKNMVTSYTKTGLTKGKTYYFTVKAYKTIDGKTYNGKYTAKSLKVK